MLNINTVIAKVLTFLQRHALFEPSLGRKSVISDEVPRSGNLLTQWAKN